MTDSKHTPGPWKVTRKHEVGPVSQQDDQSNGMIVPIADVFGENKDADAYLIGAAPDMLRALEEAFQTLTSDDACNIAPILGSDNPHEHAAGLVKAAIAKAKGL